MGQPGNALVSKLDFSNFWYYSIYKNKNTTFIVKLVKLLSLVFLKFSYTYFTKILMNSFNENLVKKIKFRFHRRSKVSNKILKMTSVFWDRRTLVGSTESKIWIHTFKDYFIINWTVYKNAFKISEITKIKFNKFFNKKLPFYKTLKLNLVSINFKKINFFKIKKNILF